MLGIKAKITGVHGYVPSYVLTNEELSMIVNTSDEWITSRTGIKERRILREPGKATSDMGYEVLKGLLEKTNTDPMDLDMLICGTITGDMIFPDTANTILDKVGAKKAYGFDINAACSGFLYSLTVGAKFVESGTHKKVAVIGADKMSSIVDYTDRTTCVIFGDGAGGVLLEPCTDGYGVIDSALHADGSGRQFLHMKAGGSLKPPSEDTVKNKEHFIFQDGKPVFKAAVNGMISSIEEVLQRNGLTINEVDWLVPHQANIRIINAVAEGLNFPKDRVMINIDKYGNTTAGTLPLCLWEYEPRLRKGDKLLLTAFGGGYTWGTTYIKWAYNS